MKKILPILLVSVLSIAASNIYANQENKIAANESSIENKTRTLELKKNAALTEQKIQNSETAKEELKNLVAKKDIEGIKNLLIQNGFNEKDLKNADIKIVEQKQNTKLVIIIKIKIGSVVITITFKV